MPSKDNMLSKKKTFDRQTFFIIFGGCFMAWLSAAVNVGFLIYYGTSVSHLTGDISRVAVDLVNAQPSTFIDASTLFLATLGFILGACFAGYYISHPRLELRQPYGRTIVIIGTLLLTAHFALGTNSQLAVMLAATACGIQNAMATHYRGVILRTTHLTGLLTDLGSNLGMRLRGHDIEFWKIAIPALLALSFFGGSIFGSLLVLKWERPFLLILSGVYLLTGFLYAVVRRLRATSAPH